MIQSINRSIICGQLSLILATLVIKPAISEEISKVRVLNARTNKINYQQVNKNKLVISAKDLLGRQFLYGSRNPLGSPLSQNNLTRVTGVELNQTDKGLQVILKTEGKQLVPLILPEGNSLAIDILDATLALPTGDRYRETNPAPGIESIALTPVDATSIRLTITGESQAPDAEVLPSNENLILSITPEAVETADESIEEINVVVTATRTAEDESDVDRSVTVIGKDELEDQRFQMLYSGGRDRASSEDVDLQEVDPYAVFDLISTVEIGKGILNLGIQNLFNNQYFTANSQLLRLRTNESYTAAPGITFSLKYAFEF